MSKEWREWMAERELRRTAEGIVRELAPDTERLCWVKLPESGDRCPAKAALAVYGLPFCEVHGAEARAGALAELYFDAEQFLEGLEAPDIPEVNAEALKAIRQGAAALNAKLHVVEGEEEERALKRAYPLIPDLVDPETREFDYAERRGEEPPEDWYRRPRLLLCKLMRLAYRERAAYVVEALEPLRESASAQLAYALQYHGESRMPAGTGSGS